MKSVLLFIFINLYAILAFTTPQDYLEAGAPEKLYLRASAVDIVDYFRYDISNPAFLNLIKRNRKPQSPLNENDFERYLVERDASDFSSDTPKDVKFEVFLADDLLDICKFVGIDFSNKHALPGSDNYYAQGPVFKALSYEFIRLYALNKLLLKVHAHPTPLYVGSENLKNLVNVIGRLINEKIADIRALFERPWRQPQDKITFLKVLVGAIEEMNGVKFRINYQKALGPQITQLGLALNDTLNARIILSVKQQLNDSGIQLDPNKCSINKKFRTSL